MKDQIEIANKNLDRVIDWIKNADSKSNIILALNGGIVAIIAANFSTIWEIWSCESLFSILPLLLILSIAGTIYFAIRVLIPEVKPKGDNKLFFFGTIASFEKKDFENQFKNITEKETLDSIIEQIYINSLIAKNKFDNLNKSIKWLSFEIVIGFALLFGNLFFN